MVRNIEIEALRCRYLFLPSSGQVAVIAVDGAIGDVEMVGTLVLKKKLGFDDLHFGRHHKPFGKPGESSPFGLDMADLRLGEGVPSADHVLSTTPPAPSMSWLQRQMLDFPPVKS